MEYELICEVFEPVSIVSEMATGGDTLVSLSPDVVERVTDGDSDPKFATFVIESGWSKSNRLWDTPIFDSVHEQISDSGKNDDPICGYMGHIRPEDDPYVFPEIQFQWLRSAIKKVGDKAHIFTKAYVLPDTKARYYLKKGLAKSVSWYGPAAQIPFQKGARVSDFKLESIDLARPRKAGMSARLVALTSEMQNGEGADVKPEEIAALQENELRAHNPGLVQSIEQAASKTLSDKVSEMEDEKKALDADHERVSEIRKLLSVADDADPVEYVTKLIEEAKKAGRGVREKILDDLLAKKFKGVEGSTMNLVRRTLVSEMETKEIQLTGDEQKDQQLVSEMFNATVDGDADLKALVSEMEEAPPNLPTGERDRTGGGDKELKAGDENAYVSVRARR